MTESATGCASVTPFAKESDVPQRDVDRAADGLARATAALDDATERLAARLGPVLAPEDPRAVPAEARTVAVCALSGTLDDSRDRVERATAVLKGIIDRLQV